MMLRFVLVCLAALAVAEAAVIQDVRSKISAGDLTSADANATEFCEANPKAVSECASALSWLARGALALGKMIETAVYVDATRQALGKVTEADSFTVTAKGNLVETEAKLLAAQGKREAALWLLENELRQAKGFPLQARFQKNIHLLSLKGKPAPGYTTAWTGKPTLLFLWAHWCGDCKAQAAALSAVQRKYGERLRVVAPTTRYQTMPGIEKPSEEQENSHIEEVWKESYSALKEVAHPIDPALMLRYGGSSTPTFVLIDSRGVVRQYLPYRMSVAALEKILDGVN